MEDGDRGETNAAVFECVLWTLPGILGFWTEHKRRTPGWGASRSLRVAEDLQPGRAEGLQAPQPPGSYHTNRRLATHGSAAPGLDTWQEQRKLTIVPVTAKHLVWYFNLNERCQEFIVIVMKHSSKHCMGLFKKRGSDAKKSIEMSQNGP